MGNPIYVADAPSAGMTTSLSDQLRDYTVDVPGRKDNQSTLDQLFFSGPLTAPSLGVDQNQRDASSDAPIRVATRDAMAEGQPGILGRMWNAMAHPLQTVENTGKSTGTAIGSGVRAALQPILDSIKSFLLPLLIIVGVIFLGGLFIIGQRTRINARL